ncbi:MAG: hypothetical protein COY66_00750 [Candidatus Kerfeldbacteria bacterium CG_4_10_14_0_8_um_filter_42_10]|uniref:Adenylate kinase n=1 Tax=Candidatus Kerfeldbacteria bacterium CG_4_10_14_0_8_um_filter_42_10 TaxID=2014248 RepID=A0A2M7RKD3_9BACT|nr:MAG: hypothetical protein COY66_00750 [Candidatus Kerfeldbacteria bacterium CG_4_10_14_0_8_um_filter_42_10]
MIYLIGGSPRSGKGILSQKLSQKLNIPYISTDDIIPIVIPYLKKNELAKKFPLYVMDIKELMKKYTGKDRLKFDIKEAKSIWPGVKNLILYLVEGRADYIIEGVHLLPNLVKGFLGNRNIKIIFLTKLNKDKIFRGILNNKNNRDWVLDNFNNKKDIQTTCDHLRIYGEYFARETKKYKLKCFNTEDNFHNQLKQALHFLTN